MTIVMISLTLLPLFTFDVVDEILKCSHSHLLSSTSFPVVSFISQFLSEIGEYLAYVSFSILRSK